ncbi:MAG: hypothetical protein AAF298_30505 [Cyanobacteria bacterium P01_A01_bin.40]
MEFIDLHKWSILDQAGHFLVAAHHHRDGKSQSFKLQRVPSISNQLLVQVTTQQLIDGLKDFVPPQPYIEELLPFFSS